VNGKDGGPSASLDHVGVVVSNLETSMRWYTDVLGVTPVGEPYDAAESHIVFMSRGNLEVQLIQQGDEGAPPCALESNDAGAMHVCVVTRDVDAEHERLLGLGIEPTTPPATLLEGTPIRAMYLRDPDRVLVQILELPEDWPHPLGTSAAGVHHVGFTVTDLEASVDWYGRTLGLNPVAWHDNGGEVVSKMFEVPGTQERAALLPTGECGLEVLVWNHPKGRGYSLQPTDVGAIHLAFVVDDVAATRERLLDEDPTPLRTFDHGRASGRIGFNVGDPDGIQVELLQLPA
jgi:catechol 2,3-dioxygenase-like lactoylglutathione lyase family enzyme